MKQISFLKTAQKWRRNGAVFRVLWMIDRSGTPGSPADSVLRERDWGRA
jgi:hypothetical protein